MILDLLASGAMSLTSVRMLRPHLTPENHEAVLARASRRSCREIEALVAPERYRVQFTIGKESHDKLRRIQALLRREIPNGDPAVIFDRALSLLLEKVEKTKLGAAAKPRAPRPIRPGADRQLRTPIVPSRDIPRHIKRAAERRDGGQCAFVSPDGHRCTERTFLEFHHIVPYARGGLATVENISLRCRRHNQYEAQLIFGPHRIPKVRETHGFQSSAPGVKFSPVVE